MRGLDGNGIVFLVSLPASVLRKRVNIILNFQQIKVGVYKILTIMKNPSSNQIGEKAALYVIISKIISKEPFFSRI